MKILTLEQPWAWAVLNGYMPLLNSNGEGIEISGHRYLGIYAPEVELDLDAVGKVIRKVGIDRVPETYITGAVLGIVKVSEVTSETSSLPIWYRQWRDNDYRYAWIVKGATEIQPFKCEGAPAGLWTPSSEIRDVVLGLYKKEISSKLMVQLRNKRKEQKISQERLAELSGYTPRHIINIENRGTTAIEGFVMMLDALDATITLE